MTVNSRTRIATLTRQACHLGDGPLPAADLDRYLAVESEGVSATSAQGRD
jgi:hypothetical protein